MASLLGLKQGWSHLQSLSDATLSACNWKISTRVLELKYRLDPDSIAASYRAICNAPEDGVLMIAV
jgi:hypothetical protein